jgi:hypothetical protein
MREKVTVKVTDYPLQGETKRKTAPVFSRYLQYLMPLRNPAKLSGATE